MKNYTTSHRTDSAKHPRWARRLYPILMLVLLGMVVYPSLATQAQAPYVYYALSDNPWSLVRRDSDGSNPVTIYTPPVDYVRAIAIDHVSKMYFYDSQSGAETIYQSDFDGSNRTTFLSAKITALAAGKGYVYYALYNSPWSLMRRDADGSNPVTIYTPPVDYVRAIAIDFANDKLYFYDNQSGSETIYKSDLDGSNRTTFVSAKINALAVGSGYVYYALSNDPWTLVRRDIDGSNPVIVYTPPVDVVRAIAVDPTSSKVYFYDSQVDSATIYKSDLDGSNRATFLSAKILVLAMHGEGPTSITLQRFTASESQEFIYTEILFGLFLLGFAGMAILRRWSRRRSS